MEVPFQGDNIIKFSIYNSVFHASGEVVGGVF